MRVHGQQRAAEINAVSAQHFPSALLWLMWNFIGGCVEYIFFKEIRIIKKKKLNQVDDTITYLD